MKLTHVRLCVDDLPGCYAFYRDVLKFKPRFEAAGSVYAEFDAAEEGGIALALFEHKLMQAAIDKPHGDADQPAERVVLSLFVQSVDETFAMLEKAGVNVVKRPHDQADWMLRVAHLRDPAGNLIELHAPLAGQKV